MFYMWVLEAFFEIAQIIFESRREACRINVSVLLLSKRYRQFYKMRQKWMHI